MSETTQTKHPIEAYLKRRRPEARRALLTSSLTFVAMFSIFLLIANIQELRMFDAVFIPSIFLLVIVSLSFGYVMGSIRVIRHCLNLLPKDGPKSD